MTEPAREVGTYWIAISLTDLKMTVVANDDDTEFKIDQTLDEHLQSVIDAATVGPSNLNGLIVLHASLRRWSLYARRALKLLERERSRPGYRESPE